MTKHDILYKKQLKQEKQFAARIIQCAFRMYIAKKIYNAKRERIKEYIDNNN